MLVGYFWFFCATFLTPCRIFLDYPLKIKYITIRNKINLRYGVVVNIKKTLFVIGFFISTFAGAAKFQSDQHFLQLANTYNGPFVEVGAGTSEFTPNDVTPALDKTNNTPLTKTKIDKSFNTNNYFAFGYQFYNPVDSGWTKFMGHLNRVKVTYSDVDARGKDNQSNLGDVNVIRIDGTGETGTSALTSYRYSGKFNNHTFGVYYQGERLMSSFQSALQLYFGFIAGYYDEKHDIEATQASGLEDVEKYDTTTRYYGPVVGSQLTFKAASEFSPYLMAEIQCLKSLTNLKARQTLTVGGAPAGYIVDNELDVYKPTGSLAVGAKFYFVNKPNSVYLDAKVGEKWRYYPAIIAPTYSTSVAGGTAVKLGDGCVKSNLFAAVALHVPLG